MNTMIKYRHRQFIYILFVFLLVLNTLTFADRFKFEYSPSPLLVSFPFHQETISNQQLRSDISFLEPAPSSIIDQVHTEKVKTNRYIKGLGLARNLNISLITLCIFYIYYRLSRTDTDDVISNMVMA